MATFEFIVKVRDLGNYGGSMITDFIRTALTTMEGEHFVSVAEIMKYDPEGEKPLDKIKAIKRIRTLLGTGLMDAKFLTDTAVSLGEAKWSGVLIQYTGSETGQFRVIDNR